MENSRQSAEHNTAASNDTEQGKKDELAWLHLFHSFPAPRRLQQVSGTDPLLCPQCSGPKRTIAFIESVQLAW